VIKIGNIYTDNKFFDKTLYNVGCDINKIDNNIPTLIVGYELAKKFSTNFNILEEKIDENIFWTFGKMEQRNVFEKSFDKFQNLCLCTLKNKTKYSFFNVLTQPQNEKLKFFDKIKSSEHCVYTVINDMIYFNTDYEDCVIGMSLRDIDYASKNKNILLSQIKSMENTTMTPNITQFPPYLKSFLLNNQYLIVKLYD
jgi:hypothetical protein